MSVQVKFAKIKENAIIPTKKDEDSSYDIYACFDEPYIMIPHNQTVKIPTGIASAFNQKYGFKLEERGSTGTKGIGVMAGVIDSGYRGEWLVPIVNHNDKPLLIMKTEEIEKSELNDDYIVYPYEKAICQATLRIIPYAEIEEITYEELKEIPSERKMGKLGSSVK